MKCGIDFSINYPAICIEEDNNFKFYSFIREGKLTKKQLKSIEDIKSNFDFINFILFQTKADSLTYKDSELIKIIDAKELVDLIFNKVFANKIVNSLNIGIEGASYNSFGRGASDLIGYQYILRYKLINNDLTFEILAPTSIKKVAGKGNYKKDQMIERFLEDFPNKAFSSWIYNNIEMFKTPKGSWSKVLEDISDSYWIVKTLQ